MNKVKVQESKIHGLGLFADQEFNEGDMIGLAHYNGVPSEIIGKFHNHSDNPNAHSVTIGNKRFLVALNPLRKGEEITVDYREQPELEQPEEFAKGGLVNMPKPSKKGLASKRYSRDLTATNRLFTKNPLLKKPKSKKRKIYDPNAKYYQDGGIVELDGYRFKKDANGNWTYESGAPVTDRGMIQRLTYEAKPVGSPVVQSRPKPSLDKPVNHYTTINKLKNSPVLADQEKVKKAESLALEELVYNPVVPNIRSKEDFPNDVEGLIDEALNFPEARARIAAKAAVDPGEDPSDPFRHSNAARYTAESIKDYVADVPYQSIPFIGDAVNEYMDNYVAPGLGFLGANLLGLAHEASIFVRDARPVDIKYRESFEDMYNNYVGAKTGASDMSPEAKTNYLLYLSRTNRLPDGVVPKPGSNKNLYIKSGPNDPGKFKSSYEDGGELDTYPIGGGPDKGKKGKKSKKVQPYVTSDPAEYALRKKAYDDSLRLYKAYQMQDKLMGPGSYEIQEYTPYKWNTQELKAGRKKTYDQLLKGYYANDYQSEKDQFKRGYNNMTARKKDQQLIKYYKSLGFTDKDIMYHSSPDIVSDKIKAVGTYYDGTADSPIYEKPVQTVIFQPKPIIDNLPPGISKSQLEKAGVIIGDKAIVGYEEVQQLDPTTGTTTTVINPVYKDLEKPIPTLHPTRVNPELQKFVYPETELEETEDIVEEDVTPEEQIYVDEEGNYVDEEGNYVDMGRKGILPDLYIDTHKYRFSTPKYRLRRPGHGGDLIKRVGTNYHFLPGIERGLSSHSYMDYEQD